MLDDRDRQPDPVSSPAGTRSGTTWSPRPGGNVTGFSGLIIELSPKRVELLSELVPQARVIALLVNPDDPSAEGLIGARQEAARRKAVQLPILKASTEGEIDAAFTTLLQLPAGALVVSPDPLFSSRRAQLVELASRHAVPAIYPWPELPAAGGLISYGANITALYRQAGIYAGRILRGAKPADLPVEQPTRFELVINPLPFLAVGSQRERRFAHREASVPRAREGIKTPSRRLTAAGKGGRIVNLASVAGLMAMPKRTAYVASKHGVVGLTRQMALEFGEFDIRVNAVAPGLVRTPMTERYFQDPAMAQTIRDIHAVGRWAEPHEIANAILFLAAEENAFITGTILTVDGGLPLAKRCRLRNVTMEVQYYPTPITKSPVAAVT